MHINPYRLHAKGMPAAEIENVRAIILRAQEHKPKKLIALEKALYWILLAIAIIGNVLVSLYLVPFIILLNNTNLYIVLVIMGAAFGVMFSALIRDLEIQLHHHTLILFVVPVVAFINLFIITTMANVTAKTYQLNTHNPAFVGLLYIAAFLLPYLNFLFATYVRKEKV